MYWLSFYAFFLITNRPLLVECDDSSLQTFTLTAVNATTMRLDSSISSSYVFAVVGNRSTANCTFTGLDATQSNWLVSSLCPGVTNEGSFYLNHSAFDFEFDDPSELVGPWTVSAVQRSRSAVGGSQDDPSYEPLPSTTLERWWDFGQGKFVIEEQQMIDDDHNAPLSSGVIPVGKKRRKKRNVLSDYQLELGVNVDQCLWDQFLSTYGPDMGTARQALDDYVDAIVATANLMWNLDSIQPNIAIRVVKYQVWTTQPEEAPAANEDDMENYLQSTCLLAKPNASGFDHSTVLSGCNLTQNGQWTGGLAYSDQLCTAFSCSVISGGVDDGLHAGYTLAHEIGHAINMKHDGDTNYAETSNCDPNCCMMTPYGASSTVAEWSVCSKMRYHEKLVEMMIDDDNCLESLDAVTPPGDIPGQSDEAQCMNQLGSCGRQYISDVSDCTKLYCTNTNGQTAISFNIVRLNGSYCGPDKFCMMGVCLVSSVSMPVVDGGWSAWNSNPEEICGGGDCSICTVNDQVSARVEVRSCDNPFPLNGGAPCAGLNVRGYFCADCPDTGSLTDVDSYETNECSADYPGSVATASTDCTFVCSIDGVFQGRLWLPTGSLCFDNGRCINGQCFHALCADVNVYVGVVSDCPTDSVVDCRYSSWSSWSDCSVTCDTGSQTRTRTIEQVALNGGIPCDQSSLEDVLSCNPMACECTLSSWTDWTTCSVTCGTGTQTRDRSVEVPGNSCDQPLQDVVNCTAMACECTLSSWTDWTTCSVTCGTGTQTRDRSVEVPGNFCDKPLQDVLSCNPMACECTLSSWTDWTTCSVTCGTGTQTRDRSVEVAGNSCDQPLQDVVNCTTMACECTLSSWTDWTTCSVTCGTGTQTRDRSIEVPGNSCDSQLQDTQSCEDVACPVDCAYSNWGAWSVCSVTCSTGTRTQTRTITVTSANGGSPCDETSLSATQSCVLDACPSQRNCSFQLTAANVYGGNLGSTPRLVTNVDRAKCEATCLSEGVSSTSPCTAYLYTLNFCNLYNKISGTIQQANLSTNYLYEYSCMGDAPLNRTLCNFYATQANFVVGSADLTVNQGAVTGPDMCHLQCLSRLAASCVGLAYNSQTRSCIFYRAVPAVLVTNASSAYTFYQPKCLSISIGPSNGSDNATPKTTISQVAPATTPTSMSTSTFGSVTAPNGCPYVKTWSTVWQGTHFSSQWEMIGPQASCASSCNEWSQFSCQGYLSAGPGRECILFGTITGQILAYNQSIYDLYEPICPGGSTEHTVCSFDTLINSVNTSAAGSGIFGGYFKFQASCAQLCILNFGILPCAAFIYEWDNGMCTLYPEIPTEEIDLASSADLYVETCKTQRGNFQQIADGVHVKQYFGETQSKTVVRSSDCFADCEAETSFVCTAFLWASPNGDCVLFDQINLNIQVFKNDGSYKLYTEACNGATPSIGYCQFEITQPDSAVSTSLSSLSPGMTSASGCRDFCIANYRGPNCTAFTVTPGELYSKCTLYYAVSSSDVISGTLDLWTIVCHTAPVNCVYGSWTDWSASTCSATCGGGMQTRTRPIQTQGGEGGVMCDSTQTTDSQTCNTQACSTDCTYTSWSSFGTCSVSCGSGGTQTRTRLVAAQPTSGGMACDSSSLSETQSCNADVACPVDCVYSSWGSWTTCSVSCGGGTQSWSRTIITEGANGGTACDTSTLTESQACSTNGCPMDCMYSMWGNWGSCSVTCGGGTQTQIRTIANEATNGGTACDNNLLSQTQTCSTNGCPMDCIYSNWGDWGSCSVTCGGGIQTQDRTIISEDTNGGTACDNNLLSQTQACSTNGCPMDCIYGSWGSWGSCSVSCDSGTQERTRPISSQEQNGGVACQSSMTSDSQACDTGVLCFDGNCVYGDWSSWGSCSSTCEGGEMTRTRDIITQGTFGTQCTEADMNDMTSCSDGIACPDACQIKNVDPKSRPSSKGYKAIGNSPDCAAACMSYTSFMCEAYATTGPGGSCILHGTIDQHTTVLPISAFTLYDIQCAVNKTANTSICMWGMVKTNVVPTAIGSGSGQQLQQAVDATHCQTLCQNNFPMNHCSAFAFCPDVNFYMGPNCYMYGPLSASDVSNVPTNSSSTFDLYMLKC